MIIHPPNPLPLAKEGGIFTRGIWLDWDFLLKRLVLVMIEEDAASLTPTGERGIYIPPEPALLR